MPGPRQSFWTRNRGVLGDVTPAAGPLCPADLPPHPAPNQDPRAPEDLVRDRDDEAPVEHDPTGIRDLLARLPEPGPMPDDLVARITASLAQEAAAERSSRTEGGARVVDLRPQRRSRWPLVGVAAAVLAVLGIGGLVVNTMPGGLSAALDIGGGNGADSAGSAAELAPSTAAADIARGDVVVTSSGTAYDVEHMSEQAAALSASTDPAVPPATGRAAAVATPSGARSCADGLGVAPEADLVLDISTVGAEPAAVLLVTGAGGRSVYAVPLSCSAQNPEVIAGPMPVTP